MHSLTPALILTLALTLTLNHLANEVLQTTTMLFMPAQRIINIS